MKKNKLPRPISILILTLLTAIIWVSLNIYRAIVTQPPLSVPESVSKTLNPTLNKDAITKIESAVFFQDSEIPPISIIVNETPVPKALLPSPTPIAVSEATISASPQP